MASNLAVQSVNYPSLFSRITSITSKSPPHVAVQSVNYTSLNVMSWILSGHHSRRAAVPTCALSVPLSLSRLLTVTPVQVEGQETGTPALHVPTRMAVNVERREWTAADKVNHSDACKNKGRLTLAEKLQIIHLYQEVPVHERKKQKDLAVMFCKSRMTICKVLRKESVDKIKALAATGICLRAKRSRIVRYPKFEQSLLEQLGPNGTRLLTRCELLVKARALSNAMNIADLTMDYKWCSRFMKHYAGPRDSSATSEGQTEGLLDCR